MATFNVLVAFYLPVTYLFKTIIYLNKQVSFPAFDNVKQRSKGRIKKDNRPAPGEYRLKAKSSL